MSQTIPYSHGTFIYFLPERVTHYNFIITHLDLILYIITFRSFKVVQSSWKDDNYPSDIKTTITPPQGY